MAIVKMTKLSVIGLETDKAALFDRLMDLGVAELRDQSQKLQEEEWTRIVQKDGEEDAVSALDSRINALGTVLEMIGRQDTKKPPLLPTRKFISREEYERVLGDGKRVRKDAEELERLYGQWNDHKTEENVLTTELASLAPWTNYDLPLEYTGTAAVRAVCGVIPAVADAEEMRRKVTEVSEATDLTIISKDQEQQYLSILYMKADEEPVMDVLKSYGYTPAGFREMTGTVSENLTRLNERLSAVKEEEKQVEERFKGAVSMKEELQYYYDSLIMQRDKAKASGNLLKTSKAFYLECWVVSKSRAKVQALLDELGCWYEFTEPAKDEETPVLLENNGLVTPFETVTELYSLPSSTEIDPTPIFSFFYFMFFGMMFADMGYGLILSVVCFAALKLYKLEGLAYKLIKMLAFCGISTFIWGALFGGFFGNFVTEASKMFLNREISIKPLWFDPLSNPMKMLIFSCIIGGVHLAIGMGVNAYLLLRDGKIVDAIENVFVWYAFLAGVVLLLFGGDWFTGSAVLGKWLAIIGAAGIVGIPAVRGKGIGRAVGLWNLYGCTGYLGDVLSYSRLLALGLASAVIAQVFNALGGMLGHGIVAMIGFIIIALIGHVFNFGINALGTFVHASRLQYVEFFGKFYQGGGVPFKPFKKNTKYVNIVKEEK